MTKKIKKDGSLEMAFDRMMLKLEEVEKRALNKKENKDKNSEIEIIETVKKDRRGVSALMREEKKTKQLVLKKLLIPPVIYDEFVKEALILRAKLLKDAKEKL